MSNLTIIAQIQKLASDLQVELNSIELARHLDKQDQLSSLRHQFTLPVTPTGTPYLYFLGNSLGPQPRKAPRLVNEELEVWAKGGNTGHFNHPYGRPWVRVEEEVAHLMAPLVGAKITTEQSSEFEGEVAIMGSLTTNLHLLMIAFYHPTPQRYKIVLEKNAFPSHYYAVESQLRMHGIDPQVGMLLVEPKEDQDTIERDVIEQIIKKHGDSIAIVLFSGVQYLTGQFFDMAYITQLAHNIGAYAGFDLAHAVGNVPLQLHQWQVDFAVWCSYKYLNAGPGAIAGLFVHDRHNTNSHLTILRGWWGHRRTSRFLMTNQLDPILGAGGFQLSNPDVLSSAALLASLDIFAQTNIEAIRAKSILLSGYLRLLLNHLLPSITDTYKIITPIEETCCGAQLSIVLGTGGKAAQVVEECKNAGLLVDFRVPNTIRIAPVALYNTFVEVFQAAHVMAQVTRRLFAGNNNL